MSESREGAATKSLCDDRVLWGNKSLLYSTVR